MFEMIEVETPACPECGLISFLSVPKTGYGLWKGGMFIQLALPDLSSNDRELLLTGFHPECWDIAFPPEDEEEDYGDPYEHSYGFFEEENFYEDWDDQDPYDNEYDCF